VACEHGAELSPNAFCSLNNQRQFCPLVRFGERVAGYRAGKAALRADGKTIEIDVAGRLFCALLERVKAFEQRTLSTDESEYHTFAFWHETQRCEVASTLSVACLQVVTDGEFRRGSYWGRCSNWCRR
jgi:hypothetical protein